MSLTFSLIDNFFIFLRSSSESSSSPPRKRRSRNSSPSGSSSQRRKKRQSSPDHNKRSVSSTSSRTPRKETSDRRSRSKTPKSSPVKARRPSSTRKANSPAASLKSPGSASKGRSTTQKSPARSSRRSSSPESSSRTRYSKTSTSDEKKPQSPVKRKHSPIVLGLDKRSNRKSKEDSKTREEVSESFDSKKDDSKPEIDDFDYSSFKSSRRVSLSKKLRDPDAEKKSPRSVSASLGLITEDKEDKSIEISSKSLRDIIPEVLPLSDSEMKFGESEERDESLGSLSDGELRERKILLQEKLKGLEEENKSGSTKKRKSSQILSKTTDKTHMNGHGKVVAAASADAEEKEFSDAEEEEKALRLAAQQSMKNKLSKKEPVKKRVSTEDSNKPAEKKKPKRDKDDADCTDKKNVEPARKVMRSVEGPAIVVRKPPSIAPARHDTTCVVVIKFLTRPFTLRQLQTLLQRTGRIVKDGFWVDNIKSVCIAQVIHYLGYLLVLMDTFAFHVMQGAC